MNLNSEFLKNHLDNNDEEEDEEEEKLKLFRESALGLDILSKVNLSFFHSLVYNLINFFFLICLYNFKLQENQETNMKKIGSDKLFKSFLPEPGIDKKKTILIYI